MELNINNKKDIRLFAGLKIGVAKDAVFSFYYPESLAVLAEYGAEIIEFSPLCDKYLPEVDALILGGGFPEMFVEELAANFEMLSAIKKADDKKMPIYAECGGFMYLCSRIVDFKGKAYDMVGIIPAICKMNDKLQTVGYVKARAVKDNILCKKDEFIKGHEFHFSTLEYGEGFPWAYNLQGSRQKEGHLEGYSNKNILASYLHLSFDGNPKAGEKLIESCERYHCSKEGK